MIFIEYLKGSIKKLGFTQGICYQLMINISINISRDLGVIPGGEFRRAVIEVLISYNFLFYGLHNYMYIYIKNFFLN